MTDTESNLNSKKLTFFLFAYWYDPRWVGFVGATVKIWDLADNLSYMGHKVVLFLPKSGIVNNQDRFKLVKVPYIDLPVIRLLSFNLFLFFILVSKYFFDAPDIVYVRRMTSLIPLIYSKLRDVRFFYEINDDPFKNEYHEGSRLKFTIRSQLSVRIDQVNLRLCDKAFVITNEVIRKIINFDPLIRKRKLILLPSGSNIELFKPLDKRECCQKLNLDPSRKYVGFIGSLLMHQGIDTLIKAAEIVIRKIPDCEFLIIGEGPMKAKWIRHINRLSLTPNFYFAGQKNYEDVPKWIAVMDVCVAPFNRSAGLRSPVKLFDYLACSKPVIASKIKGTTDVFENTDAIILVDPETPRQLAKEILSLLNNETKAYRMGMIGRQFIIDNYSRKMLAKKITIEAE